MVTPTEARVYETLVQMVGERWGGASFSQVTRALWRVLYNKHRALEAHRAEQIRANPMPTRAQERASHEIALARFLEGLFCE